MYKWGHEKLKDDKGKEVSMHFSKLHKAPHGSIVYRGLIDERLRALTNQAQINSRYSGIDREITIFPLKKGPYGSTRAIEFYNISPERNQIKSSTHFFIIGDQHTIGCYKNLIQVDEIDDQTKPRHPPFLSFRCLCPRPII